MKQPFEPEQPLHDLLDLRRVPFRDSIDELHARFGLTPQDRGYDRCVLSGLEPLIGSMRQPLELGFTTVNAFGFVPADLITGVVDAYETAEANFAAARAELAAHLGAGEAIDQSGFFRWRWTFGEGAAVELRAAANGQLCKVLIRPDFCEVADEYERAQLESFTPVSKLSPRIEPDRTVMIGTRWFDVVGNGFSTGLGMSADGAHIIVMTSPDRARLTPVHLVTGVQVTNREQERKPTVAQLDALLQLPGRDEPYPMLLARAPAQSLDRFAAHLADRLRVEHKIHEQSR